MKIRALALNQFKKFTRPTRLVGFADGLNVVVGPNEMGKSTLLDALRAALFEKHSSKAQPITALQNELSQAGPVVELNFEIDDREYTIAKRFVKKPYARLACPDGSVLEGDAAEDTLRGLLGFHEPGKAGAKPEMLGMWDVLWVRQGHSFGGLDLPESARASLHGALESEVGAVLGGHRGRALTQAIERQLAELVTGTGKPRGAYREHIERVAALEDELEALRERRRELADTLDALEQTETKLKRLEAPERDAADEAELEAARERHRRLAALEDDIATAKRELEVSERALAQAEQTRADRERLKQTIASEREELETAHRRRDELRELTGAARTKRDALHADVREAETAVTRADAAVARERRTLAAVEREARVRELETRLAKARDAEQRRRAAQQSAAAVLVTDERLDAIRAAAQRLDTVTHRLNAAATRITLDFTADGAAGVEIDGEPAAAGPSSLKAVDTTTISIPQRGRITIEPAVADRNALLEEQRNAEAELAAALEHGGAHSVADAEEQHTHRRRQLEAAERARHEAELHAPAESDREAGADALADYVEGLRQVLARETAELELDALPARTDADNALKSAEQHAESARQALATARATLDASAGELSRLQSELDNLEGRCETSAEQLASHERELADAERTHSADELAAAIDARRAEVEQHRAAIAELEAERTEETLPQLEARITRLDEALRERRAKREALGTEVIRLRSRIEAAEGAGLDEAIEQKARELELADAERARLEREQRVLTLLLRTLRSAEHEAKERYLSPVLARVRPYLKLLFPDAEIRIDENLGITGVVRDGGHEESFERLSLGTQEQIAILVRLAFAELLLEQGHPAAVVLDDALVFSDDVRMGRMFDVLNLAARSMQIVIFTCREQLFEGLGGRRLTLSEGDAEALASA